MVTIKDIAQRTGVAPNTVSRALRGLELGVRSDAVKRAEEIRRVAQEMGYRRNANARAARTGQTDAIALAYRREHEPFMPLTFLRKLACATAEREISLHLAALPETLEGETLPRIIRELIVDALIIDELPSDNWLHSTLREFQIPAIWMNQKLESDCVYPADFEACAGLVHKLAALGHRRIAYIATEYHFSSHERTAGYRKAMADAGLPERIVHKRDLHDSREPILGALLTDNPITALISNDHHVALDFMAIAYARGLEVPQDVSVVTIGASLRIAFMGRRVDSLLFPQEAIGEALVEEALAKREAPAVPRKPVVVPMDSYEENGSVGPPPSD